jgi:glyoxylase-like metal-dependent hydrolase (beta-lactamase superfamily II)
MTPQSNLNSRTPTRAPSSADARYATRAADGVFVVRTLMANVAFISSGTSAAAAPAPTDRDTASASSQSWVLVDAGIRGYANTIQRAAEECFGPGTRPECIILTHGHFDHVGSLHALLDRWDVPVYAHVLEMPHLTGRVDYPPPDPLAGGGMMAWSSRLLPKGAIDVGPKLRALPQDRSVPGAPGWEWIHTPGHTVGHVSLFRRSDRVLIAGDAVTTTKQESLLAVATQRREVHGPPAYFTIDWDAARESVWHLASLQPEVLATGHGVPLRGAAMRHALHMVAAHFDEYERPKFGRYARRPAVMETDGTYDLPRDPFPLVLAGVAGAVTGAALLRRSTRNTARLASRF